MDFDVPIGLACTILGFVVAYLTFLHNSKKQSNSDGREAGAILTELGYVKANTDEIKAEQKEQRRTNTEVITRLTSVEASAKQAHKRIDRMEGREGREE